MVLVTCTTTKAHTSGVYDENGPFCDINTAKIDWLADWFDDM